jgi:surface protein
MSGMFSGTASFSSDIGAWNTKNVTNMTSMFLNATLYDMNFAKWDYSKVTAMTGFITNTNTDVYNNVKTSMLFVRLNNNNTFKNKDIRSQYRVISYLANTTSVQAVTSLTTKKGNRINVNPITPNISTFKFLKYSVTDLVSIGYKLQDLIL